MLRVSSAASKQIKTLPDLSSLSMTMPMKFANKQTEDKMGIGLKAILWVCFSALAQRAEFCVNKERNAKPEAFPSKTRVREI